MISLVELSGKENGIGITKTCLYHVYRSVILSEFHVLNFNLFASKNMVDNAYISWLF